MEPVSTGYADVNGIKLYHEVHGQGEPLVLIHGGLTTIGEMRGGCGRWPGRARWSRWRCRATAARRTPTGR